ncbi:MAG: acylphosphatase [Zetaproteobacteria bacterium]|nr:MAG: acylphosphatase [Zetaproteobacteria bacterium]
MTQVISIRVYVSGKVQGVGYRYWTRSMAQRFGLRGWVRNTPDGRVEALLVGECTAVKMMLALMRQGPPAARVTCLVHEPAKLENAYSGFQIRQ